MSTTYVWYELLRTFRNRRFFLFSIGFPLVVRPSYVLGGRAMAIVYDMGALDRYMTHAVDASPYHPVLIDKFL